MTISITCPTINPPASLRSDRLIGFDKISDRFQTRTLIAFAGIHSQIERRHRNIRLGTLDDLPTKSAARNRLSELLKNSPPKMETSFWELAERWEKAEGSTMKATTLHHYKNALRAYVLPKFGEQRITVINREDIQTFLAEKARKYSESTLRSMRVVLGLTMGWATNCGWLERNPCSRVKLPRRTGGRRVTRTVLTAEQVNAIADKLKEPYATLVLFLAASGLRIGEALAIKWTDFKNKVLHVTRRGRPVPLCRFSILAMLRSPLVALRDHKITTIFIHRPSIS